MIGSDEIVLDNTRWQTVSIFREPNAHVNRQQYYDDAVAAGVETKSRVLVGDPQDIRNAVASYRAQPAAVSQA